MPWEHLLVYSWSISLIAFFRTVSSNLVAIRVLNPRGGHNELTHKPLANVRLAELSGKSYTTTNYYPRSNCHVSHNRVVNQSPGVVEEDINSFGARVLNRRSKVRMRCMACGAEMILVKVIEDVTMPVPGFQRRAYMCSECNETEQRLVFNKPGEQ